MGPKRFFNYVAGVALVLSTGIAHADVIDGAGAGISGATDTITFSEIVLAPGTQLGASYSPLGITSDMYYGGPTQSGSSFSTPAIYNFGTGQPCCATVFDIFFNSDVSGASFNAVNNGSTNTTFTALLNGSIVQSFVNTIPINNNASTNLTLFWGFDNIVFDQIQIQHSAAGFGIDNLSFRSVPEPTTLSLLGAGLFGLGLMRRRKTAP